MTGQHLSFDEFSERCISEAMQGERYREDYLQRHLMRFYETFRVISGLVPPRPHILSAGAGPAHLEFQAHNQFGAEITLVDYDRMIEFNKPNYDRHHFSYFALDLTTDWQLPQPEQFDMAWSFEVLEHLTITPYQHLRTLAENVKPGGYVLLSTPNLASLDKILNLLRGEPILHPPEDTFASVSYENKGTHRREYVEAEIVSAINRAGLTHVKTCFMFNRKPDYPTLKNRLRMPLYTLNVRFKPTMLLVARKNT